MAKRQIPDQQSICDDAKRPDIARRHEHGDAPTGEAFRGGILQTAQHDRGRGGLGRILADVVVGAALVGLDGARDLGDSALVGDEVGHAEVAELQVAAAGAAGVRAREVNEAILQLHVAVDHVHVLVQVAERGGQLGGVAGGEVRGEALAAGGFAGAADEVEERAALVQAGDAEGRERGVVDGAEGEDVSVAEVPPYRDFVLEFGLHLLVLAFAGAEHALSDDFDGAPDSLVAFHGNDFLDGAEAAFTDFVADDVFAVVADFLTFVIRFE